MITAISGPGDSADLWQLSLTKEIAKGVDAKLTYALLDDDYLDDRFDYFAGSIDVSF